MRSLNLDQLRTLSDVVALGSFSAAAERLNLSQPAVSLQIRQLEQRLGVRLIERVGRRAMPTAAGSELLRHAARIDTAVAAALDAMAEHAQGTIGRVRLGTGATACIYLLPHVLRELRQRFGALDIMVSTGNTADMLKAVEENRIDLALATLPAPGRMFDVTPVLEDVFVAVTSADGPGLPDLVTPGTLAECSLVLYEPGAHTRRVIDDWFLAAGHSVKPVMELGSVEAIKEIVAAGLGCTILPRIAVIGGGHRPDLVMRPLSPGLSRQLGIVLRRDKPLHRHLRAVVDALRQLPSMRAA